MNKVLIISYYWPPSGGSGVQRWLKFAKYLPEFGWQPVIYTPQNSGFALQYGGKDTPDVPVIGTKIFDPGTLFAKSGGGFKVGEVKKESAGLFARLAIWLRANVFVPDSKVFWVRKSVAFLTSYLSENEVDLIVTTGPPHSMHLIGLGVKSRTGIKWVADFRDPWSDGDILDQLGTNKRALNSHRQLEKSVLQNADLVVAVSETMGNSLAEKGEGISTSVITNGYDTADFELDLAEGDKFNLAYSGLLYNKRNPANLWLALEELLEEGIIPENELSVTIAGLIDQEVENSLLSLPKLSSSIKRLGYLSHADSIKACKAASALILTVDATKNGHMLIPGKLFEYLACEVPILGFGNPGCDADRILIESGHKNLLPYEDRDAIKTRLIEIFKNWQTGSRGDSTYNIEPYSRKKLTQKLSEEFNRLISK